MTICFFGNYISDYPRIVVMKKGFLENGVKIIECHTRKTGIAKYWDLYRQHRKIKNEYDVLLVTMAAYSLVPFARILTRKKLVFDAFVSLKLTHDDRRQSGGAFWDIAACRYADQVFLDTFAQIEYFVSSYNLPREKFIRVPTSSDPEIFFPTPNNKLPNSNFIVHWHGHIVSFHGLDTVIAAANKLIDYKDIEFRITTRFNKAYEDIKKTASENVIFFPETSYAGLARSINNSHIVLGVFGNNEKAEYVIPNKIIEAVACKKPVITRASKAVQELFDDKSMRFVEPQNVDQLVEAILELKNDANNRNDMANTAYEIYKTRLDSKIITQDILK